MSSSILNSRSLQGLVTVDLLPRAFLAIFVIPRWKRDPRAYLRAQLPTVREVVPSSPNCLPRGSNVVPFWL